MTNYNEIRPKIEWEVSPLGIIKSANKYNLEGNLLSNEEYVITILPDSLQTPYQSLIIKEKIQPKRRITRTFTLR